MVQHRGNIGADSVLRSKEKESAAFSSLIVAIALTALKAIVGILTNSLGIISEALHSGFDLVAAVTTVYALRASSKPPDKEHHYGHGKYESFSALVETLLLLVTCAWISVEAVQRLFFRQTQVEASLAGFAVMIVSIVPGLSESPAGHVSASHLFPCDCLGRLA
jgi:cation diffusion facilitator family transporter